MAEKVTKEVAIQEVDRWLSYKKVSEKKREAYKNNIEALVEAIVDGTLILNEDCTFTHFLKFPIEGDKPLSQLIYKPRLKVHTTHLHLQGVKNNDPDGRVCAHIAALTSQTSAVIRALDTEDYDIASQIAIFFL